MYIFYYKCRLTNIVTNKKEWMTVTKKKTRSCQSFLWVPLQIDDTLYTIGLIDTAHQRVWVPLIFPPNCGNPCSVALYASINLLVFYHWLISSEHNNHWQPSATHIFIFFLYCSLIRKKGIIAYNHSMKKKTIFFYTQLIAAVE